jgi:hypothetical protein
MRNDAEVSHNESSGHVGVYLESGSVMVMLDNAVIIGNKAASNGGGVAMDGASLIMRGNSAISGNSAGNGGGGIITFPNTGNGIIFSQITMEDNAVISKNTAKIGGGILLQDKLILGDNAQIIENIATETGGGVFGATKYSAVTKGKDAVIANNNAPNVPDTNFTYWIFA